MNLNFINLLAALLLFSLGMNAQKAKTATPKTLKHPATFTINKADFDNLFTKKSQETVITKSNKYLDKSTVMMNTENGDMKFMKLKLRYFSNAYLMVQVNGEYSTQIFVLSDDKSVFYKGKIDRGTVTMTKCNEDDIVSE